MTTTTQSEKLAAVEQGTAARVQSALEARAVEVDTELNELYAKSERRSHAILRCTKQIAEYEERKLRASVTADRDELYGRLIATQVAERETNRDELNVLRDRIEDLEGQYSDRVWPRYFLVTNTGGHVHSGMACASCFPTTEYAWLTSCSGCTAKSMVAEYGSDMCTVCYPQAPALKGFSSSKTGREREAAAQARADKRAAKKAAQLVVGATTYKTVRGAKNEALSMIETACWYGDRGSHSSAGNLRGAREILDAVAERTGVDARQLWVETLVKKAKKVARDASDSDTTERCEQFIAAAS